MRNTGTLVLLALGLALGAYVYFVELRGEEGRERAAAAERRLVTLERDSITALSLPLDGGGVAELAREPGGEWQLVSPVAFPADQAAVERALDALDRLEFTSEIDATADLSAYGLAEGEGARVEAATADGGHVVLRLGGDAPIGALRYVSLDGDARLVTVESRTTAALDSPLNDLRDRRLVAATPGDVRGIAIDVEGVRIAAAERGDDGWALVEPSAERADQARARRLVQDVVLARAIDFIDGPNDLSTYGLDPPEIVLGLTLADGGSARLALGRAAGTAYARSDSRDVVYAVPQRLLDGVPRSFFDLRYKRLLDVPPERVEHIELGFPREASAFHFEKRDGRWAPLDPSLALQPLAIDELVYRIDALDATSLEPSSADAAALGLSPPRVRVTFSDADAAELGWLELGDPSADADLPARSSESPRLWRIAPEIGEHVPLGLEAFWNRFATTRPSSTPSPTPDPNTPQPDAAPPKQDPNSHPPPLN